LPESPAENFQLLSDSDRAHAAALYGAFALIAAVIFGTLSVHPF
jgi:hypothetical protein